MLPPQAVPSDGHLAEWAASACPIPWAELTEVGESGLTNADILPKLGRFLSLMPSVSDLTDAPAPQFDDRMHDEYFHVRRIQGEPAAVFVHMVLSAREILHKEVLESPVSISEELLVFIDRTLVDLIACIYGKTVDTGDHVKIWRSTNSGRGAMPRWIRGHQIFAALTQGLILSFQSMGRAVRAGNADEVRRWADLSISLLRGSGATFVLTGDFSVDEYQRVIRPTMMPPAVATCLSGLMSADHRFLVQTLRELKPALKVLHDHEKRRHERLHAELATVYDRHIHVCERFVGKSPSLLTAGQTEKSGPALIEQFKTLRIKALEAPAHAARLKGDRRAPTEASCPFSPKPNEAD